MGVSTLALELDTLALQGHFQSISEENHKTRQTTQRGVR